MGSLQSALDMTLELWSAVEGYIAEQLVRPDEPLTAALAACAEAGLPAISVAPPEGKLLHLLARSIGAKAILEIGTLGGYSTIWLARALPKFGRLITLEVNAEHARVAQANLERASVGHLVELRVGDAHDTMPQLIQARSGPFDFIFIDADKASIPEYFMWALELSRPGGLIVVDNVVRDGAVIDADSEDPNIRGVRKLNEMVAANPRVSGTVIQTVGSKGYDGFAILLVT